MMNDLQPAADAHIEVLDAAASSKPQLIHIIVEVSKNDHRVVTFDHPEVTGKEIKEAAKVPLDSDLAIREPGGLDELVTNDETITIKNGERFVDLPAGTIS